MKNKIQYKDQITPEFLERVVNREYKTPFVLILTKNILITILTICLFYFMYLIMNFVIINPQYIVEVFLVISTLFFVIAISYHQYKNQNKKSKGGTV